MGDAIVPENIVLRLSQAQFSAMRAIIESACGYDQHLTQDEVEYADLLLAYMEHAQLCASMEGA